METASRPRGTQQNSPLPDQRRRCVSGASERGIERLSTQAPISVTAAATRLGMTGEAGGGAAASNDNPGCVWSVGGGGG